MNEEQGAQTKFDPEKLSPEEKFEAAAEAREIAFHQANLASKRGAELSDEFARLEVQIATILFAFAGIFVTYFSDQRLSKFSSTEVLMLRLGFSIGLALLIASLITGLLHIKRKEKFWGDQMHGKVAIFGQWARATRKETSFDFARAFQLGVAHGEEGIISSPPWTWILQTIFLGLGVTFLFVLALILLFT